MKRNLILTLSLMTVWIVSGGSAQQQSITDIFQQAVHLEEVKGDLNGAINLYKEIVADNGDNRAIAATALLRLAGCYEKLGQKEAQNTYEQLIREYPDQIDIVKVARAKLTLLDKGNTNMSMRLVWEGSEVELMGEASADGRYICYTDWDTGDIAIHDLTTGENRDLGGHTEWDGSFAENSRWSPDGKLIAYTWASVGTTAELRIVGLDGEKPRILFPTKESVYLSVEDWSPDGRQILVFNIGDASKDNAGFLSLISASDGSVRNLMKMGRVEVERDYMQFSPDGKYIAYDLQNESTSGGITFPTDKDIYLLSADGKTQIPLVKNPASDYLLGWTPDGDSILFASDRSGTVDAWVLPVKNGKPAGEARIVQKNIGAISPLGFTRDGSYFYGSGKDLWNVYIATLDGKPDSKTATYKKLGLPFEGRNSNAEFSPDGKRLAFVRASSHSGTGPGQISNNTLCIHDLETGGEETFPLNLRTGPLRWAPDSSSILIGGLHERKSFVGTIDIRTGETKALFPTDKDVREEMYVSPDWSPDGRSVYCALLRGAGADSKCTIIVKNLKTGQIRTVYEGDSSLPMISVSPDGKWLAAYEHPITGGNGGATERILKIISIEDGEARELCRFVNATNHSPFPRWSRDGRYILFPGIRPGEETWDVWYVPVEGGEPRGLGLSLHRIQDISPHPDGSRFAFSSFGSTLHGPQIWAMENFLPQ